MTTTVERALDGLTLRGVGLVTSALRGEDEDRLVVELLYDDSGEDASDSGDLWAAVNAALAPLGWESTQDSGPGGGPLIYDGVTYCGSEWATYARKDGVR